MRYEVLLFLRTGTSGDSEGIIMNWYTENLVHVTWHAKYFTNIMFLNSQLFIEIGALFYRWWNRATER